jgi:hypothetical protein
VLLLGEAAMSRIKTVTRKKQTSHSIYWFLADIKRVGSDAADYARLVSSAQAWVKADRRDVAVVRAKRQLSDAGWRVKKIDSAGKVMPGFARLARMADPSLFSEEEADEWGKQYRIAAAKGFACLFIHVDANANGT